MVMTHPRTERLALAKDAVPRLPPGQSSLPKSAQVRVPSPLREDADANVHSLDAVRASDDRVDVDLSDVRMVVGEAGQPKQGALQRRRVDRGPSRGGRREVALRGSSGSVR
jgi:hypothetical protein